jgi:glutathione peroxidase
MKLLRLLVFALLGALLPRSRRRGRALDWSSISIDTLAGGQLATGDYSGRPVLLVNTASRCGFTRQYRGLESVWRRYRDRGLIVLGVPSNDFGAQEPGGADDIARFCSATFDISFPLAAKQVVSGKQAHPLYLWAARETGALGTPSWNFHKILIGRDGHVVEWFSALGGVGPKLERAVEKALR